MSLKAFHRFFISVAILFCVWLSYSEYRQFQRLGRRGSFYVSVSSAGLGVGLVAYFLWFLRKSRKWPDDS